jgi:hypothetical protein
LMLLPIDFKSAPNFLATVIPPIIYFFSRFLN